MTQGFHTAFTKSANIFYFLLLVPVEAKGLQNKEDVVLYVLYGIEFIKSIGNYLPLLETLIMSEKQCLWIAIDFKWTAEKMFAYHVHLLLILTNSA